MNNQSTKSKTIKGLFWSGLEKFSFQLIQFLVGLVLARLLMPSDYGLIAILMVFVSFSVIFVDGGMATALIQKNDKTDEDFNTAYIYNIIASLSVYIFVFFLSPFIAKLYNEDELCILLRVLSVIIIVSSLSSIQGVQLIIDVNFKKLAKISITAAIISGILSILLAYHGAGVWSLVFQQILSNIIRSLLLVFYSSWKPNLKFSKKSFCNLFGFGSRLLLTQLLARIYDSMYPLLIGKLYPMNVLGYYNQGRQFSSLPANWLNDIFQRVTFPIMSSVKTDNRQLTILYRRYIEMSSFIVFPIMFVLVLIAKPLILLLLTEKWIEVVPYFQILCFASMFNHVSSINLNLLYVEGRSDLALKLEVIKKTTAILVLVVSSFWGIWGLCIGQVVYGVLATVLNSIYTKRLIGVSYIEQIMDYGKLWLLCLTVSIPFLYIKMDFISNNICQILLVTIIYISVFILSCSASKNDAFYYLLSLVKSKIKK